MSGQDAYFETMERFFAPYSGSHPATVLVNGHKIILLSRDPAQLEDSLELVGADRVCPVESEAFIDDTSLFKELAQASAAHVVVTPPDLQLEIVLQSLEKELPWIQ